MDIAQHLSADADTCEPSLSFGGVVIVVIISCILGLVWAAYNFLLVKRINVERG